MKVKVGINVSVVLVGSVPRHAGAVYQRPGGSAVNDITDSKTLATCSV